MNAKALIGAAIGGVIGAAIWGGIAAATGYEIGYVAWGVGLLCGGGAMWLGGSGSMMGVACALIALVSIFSGKMLAVQMSAPGEIRKLIEAEYTREMYQEYMDDAEALASLEPDADYREFMIERNYTFEEAPEDISDEEYAFFVEETVPSLRDIYENQPTYEEWKARGVKEGTDAVMAEVSLFDAAKDNLGVIDILFALLGIGTAYKLGTGSEE